VERSAYVHGVRLKPQDQRTLGIQTGRMAFSHSGHKLPIAASRKETIAGTIVHVLFAVLIASRGPFGPTFETCGLLVLFLVGPFLLFGLEIVSFLRSDPISWRYGTVLVAGVFALGWLLFHVGMPGDSTFFHVWWVIAVLSLLMAPAVGIHELARRGLLRMPQSRRRSKRGKRSGRRRPRDRSSIP